MIYGFRNCEGFVNCECGKKRTRKGGNFGSDKYGGNHCKKNV